MDQFKGILNSRPFLHHSIATTNLNMENNSNITSSNKDLSNPRRLKKFHRVRKACNGCNSSHVACDENRPCKRCIYRGVAEQCHDVPLEKRRKKIKEDEQYQQNEITMTSENDILPVENSTLFPSSRECPLRRMGTHNTELEEIDLPIELQHLFNQIISDPGEKKMGS